MDTTAADPLVGTLLNGRYRVGPRVARGGMAMVYRATDVRLDRQVAVKVLHAGYADDPDFALRFQREGRAAARLSHPNVVSVFDQGRDHAGPHPTLFLAMEYVPGCTLRDLLREQGPLSPARALALLESVLSALSAAHAAGFVHRDVKPENVLLTDDGRVKVADFGLARAVATSNQTAATSGVLIGTVSYLAPELVIDGAADARTDVYACGVLLYEMLTGHKPHQGDSPIQVAYKHVHEDVPAPSRDAAGVPSYLDALVAGATSRQRDTRFADAKVMLRQVRRVRHALDHDVADDPELTADLRPSAPVFPIRVDDDHEDTLQVLSAASPSAAASVPPTHQEPRRSRRGPVALVVVLLLAAGAAVAGWYAGVGRFTSTPDLAGLTVAQAERELDGTDLELTSTPTFSETVAAGRIIETDPAGGDRVLENGTIDAIVSSGKERYDMPSVARLPEGEAVEALSHFVIGAVDRRFSERVAEGEVIRASEQPGASLKRDTEIDLEVSKGRRPIDVPSLVGTQAPDARRSLRDLGLAPVVTREFSEDVTKGEVLSQSPEDGTRFKGDEVALAVSDGPPLIEVPSVFMRSQDSAAQTLGEAGFQVDVLRADGYVGFDLVASQSPASGSDAPKGSVVTIYLY